MHIKDLLCLVNTTVLSTSEEATGSTKLCWIDISLFCVIVRNVLHSAWKLKGAQVKHTFSSTGQGNIFPVNIVHTVKIVNSRNPYIYAYILKFEIVKKLQGFNKFHKLSTILH